MKSYPRTFLPLLLALAVLALAVPAQAHEFLLKPVKLTVKKGETVPFSVVSSHVMMISEEVEPVDHVKLSLVEGKKSAPLSVAPNPALLTLDGQFAPTREGTAILAGDREGIVWTQTTAGWVEGSKKGQKGVISSNLYEKFAKTLITVGKGDDGWSRVLGQKLEIVPLSDPTAARVGDEIGFKFLYDGKPFAPENVLATYDGFSLETMTFAYSTEPGDDGTAKVKITAPGVWMVRIQHKIDKPTADYDGIAMRAVLVFEVR
ncbi:DUF4198 domain-containing protein [Paucidesulfovibrio longus]|uniref:DUF4198 domain-containing protein n=1 Tax=Paucidesulfovibrio longus TaxID=889 RepID=UPI0003B367B7|nr:DUF4198 domain-containing protein [Paucidesulfovibrio longus]